MLAIGNNFVLLALKNNAEETALNRNREIVTGVSQSSPSTHCQWLLSGVGGSW